MPGIPITYEIATADLVTTSGGTFASNIDGVLQANGDFIFYVDHEGYRKMVKTNNEGTFIEAGYLALNDIAGWGDSTTWQGSWYRIANFHGIKGIKILSNRFQSGKCTFLHNSVLA